MCVHAGKCVYELLMMLVEGGEGTDRQSDGIDRLKRNSV